MNIRRECYLLLLLISSNYLLASNFICDSSYLEACQILYNPLYANKKNSAQALATLEANHEQGHYWSSFVLSIILRNGLYSAPNYEKSTAIMHKLADSYITPHAQFELGKWYLLGNQIKRSLPQAELYLSAAAHNGFAQQVYNLAYEVSNDALNFVALKAAASVYYEDAVLELAFRYKNIGLIDDALELLKNASMRGSIRSLSILGELYFDIHEYKKAFECFRESAYWGNYYAAFNAALSALRLYNFTQDPEDKRHAEFWFAHAAQHGEPRSLVALEHLKKLVEKIEAADCMTLAVEPAESENSIELAREDFKISVSMTREDILVEPELELAEARESNEFAPNDLILDKKPTSKEEIQETGIQEEIKKLRIIAHREALELRKNDAWARFEIIFRLQQKHALNFETADIIAYSKLCRNLNKKSLEFLNIKSILQPLSSPDAQLEYQKLLYSSSIEPEEKKQALISLSNYTIADKETNKILSQAYCDNLFIPEKTQDIARIINFLEKKHKKSAQEKLKLIDLYIYKLDNFECQYEKAKNLCCDLQQQKIPCLLKLADKIIDNPQMQKDIYEKVIEIADSQQQKYISLSQEKLWEKYLAGEIQETSVRKIYSWFEAQDINFEGYDSDKINIILTLLIDMLDLYAEEPKKNNEQKIIKLFADLCKKNILDNSMVSRLLNLKNHKYFENIIDILVPLLELTKLKKQALSLESLPIEALKQQFPELPFGQTALAYALVEHVKEPAIRNAWAQGKYSAFLVFAAICDAPGKRAELGKNLSINNKYFAQNSALALSILMQEIAHDNSAILHVAVAFYHNKNYDEAVRYFKKYFEDTHDFIAVRHLNIIAQIYYENKNYIKAFNALETILYIDFTLEEFVEEEKEEYVEIARLTAAMLVFDCEKTLNNINNNIIIIKNLSRAKSCRNKLLLAEQYILDKKYAASSEVLQGIISQKSEIFPKFKESFADVKSNAQLWLGWLIIKGHVRSKTEEANNRTINYARSLLREFHINNFMFQLYDSNIENIANMKRDMGFAFEKIVPSKYNITIFDIAKIYNNSGVEFTKIKEFVNAVIDSYKRGNQRALLQTKANNKKRLLNMMDFLLQSSVSEENKLKLEEIKAHINTSI
jgi:TPR repeat protein